jgi:hypothetical protein
MSQNLTANSIRQMPQVTSPYLLDVKISQLAANRLNQTTHTFANPQLRWIKLTMLTVLCRNRKFKSLRLKQFSLERLRNIRPVAQKQASITIGQLPNHTNVMNVGRGKVEGLDHADRVDLHMKLKTIKGLLAQFFAIVSYALKELGAFGSSKSTNTDREAVKYDNGISESFGYMLEQALLDRPQLGSLASETDSTTELWEVMPVKPFEESKDGFVLVQAEGFAYDFHGKYFAVSQLWHWTSSSKHSWLEEFFHKIISFAEYIYDKIIQVHFFALYSQWNRNLF